MKIETLPRQEVATMLRARLGTEREWTSFLGDCERDKQHIAGLQLLPVARQKIGRSYRPIYELGAVQDFIAKVLAAVPTAGKTPIKTTVLDIDLGRHWKLNKFARDGSRIAPSSPTSGGRHAA